MASVTLTEAWIHLASDLSQSVTADLTGEGETVAPAVEVRRYASGRLRGISRAGASYSFSVRLEKAERADANTLRGWVEDGEELMFRDPLARKHWGVVTDMAIDEIAGTDGTFVDISITFLRVSHTEVV